MSLRGRRGRDRNVVGFTTAYAISAITINFVDSNPAQERYNRYNIMWWRWLTPGTPVFSTNKTDRHDITEILLKVALYTITLSPP
jgi:hypothetical protein